MPSAIGSAVGPTMSHFFSPRAKSSALSGPLPNQGRCMEPLRPACAIWMPGTTLCAFMNRAIRFSGGMCAEDQMPRSPLVMRPWSVTAVASTNTRPAPPSTSRPQCAKWKSWAMPSTAA